MHEMETKQQKLLNLPELLEIYKNRQGTVNKLHETDVIGIQEKLKKAEQKLLEYSSLPELVRQLEIRVKAQQDNSVDRISTLETRLREVKTLSEKNALQQNAVGKIHQNSTRLLDDLGKGFQDVIQKQTSSSTALRDVQKELAKYQAFPGKVAQLEKNFKILVDDGNKSISALIDKNLQLSKTLESLQQGHKRLQNQLGPSEVQKASELEQKLANQLKNVTDRATSLQEDVSSLQKANKKQEKDILSCTAMLKAKETRIVNLEKSNVALSSAVEVLNATMQVNDSYRVGNITYVRYVLELTQNQIGLDVTSLRQANQKLETQLQKHEADIKSHQNDLRSHANKLKLVEDTMSKHDSVLKKSMAAQNKDAGRLATLESDSVTNKKERAALYDTIKQMKNLQRGEQQVKNKDVGDRLATLESDSLVGKKERAILYDTIKLAKADLQRGEEQSKSQNEKLSSLNLQYLNLSVALKDLRAQVKFFHSEFSIDKIVDDANRRSALHVAAMDGNVEQVTYLLRNGANAEAEDYKKWRPLHLAAWQGHFDVVRELLASGAKVNPVDEFGYTPLHWAAQYGRDTCVNLLIDMGANLEARDVNDETPLHKAAWYEQTKIVELLLKRGAKINAYRKENYTALHLAAQKGYLDIVKVLVVKGADVNLRTVDGFTAMDLALSQKQQSVVNYLNHHTQ